MFRRQWMVDLTYFFINSLLVEVLTILTLKPALILFDWARADWLSDAVGGSPIALQVLLIVLVADFTQWVHRTFHATPFLWPFHAIHHSAEEMDWLAGSRLHLVDVILTRGLTYVPIFVLGFSNAALMAYVFLVAAQATFIHANVRWRLRPVRRPHCHAGVPSLAPQRRARGGRQEFRRPHAGLGHPVRHLLPSGPLAGRIWSQRTARRSERLVQTAALSTHSREPGKVNTIVTAPGRALRRDPPGDLPHHRHPAPHVLDRYPLVVPVDRALVLERNDYGDEAIGRDAEVAQEVAVGEPAEHGGHNGSAREVLAADGLQHACNSVLVDDTAGVNPMMVSIWMSPPTTRPKFGQKRLRVLIWQQPAVDLGPGLRRHDIDLLAAAEARD